ncbi:DUF5131 family protein [Sinorhizobium meliloti]|nr:DUF5131 family protein [Sinorhizobium meliloti]MDX0093474.1 DUF5131 family protein [Sinorhizobium meliloti]
MADGTKIEWTDATWNPITGCAVVSPGCTNCYAMKLAGTRLKNHESRKGLTKDTKSGPVWTGEVRFNRQWLDQPLRWTKPRMIFVCAHGDLFAEGVDEVWIDYVFAVMALAPQHTFQVLTKRPERMREYMHGMLSRRQFISGYGALVWGGDRPDLVYETVDDAIAKPLGNVWLGVSVEDQKRADGRRDPMQALAEIGWLTWVSYEPAIGPVDWTSWEFIRWLVSGGESGPRSSHPEWHRAARDFCANNSIPFLFKQWGSWAPSTPEEAAGNPRSGWVALSGNRPAKAAELYPDAGAAFVANVGKKAAGRLLDGIEHNGFPEARR